MPDQISGVRIYQALAYFTEGRFKKTILGKPRQAEWK